MATETEQQQEATEQANGANGETNGGHRTAVRAAAIAAATGATAFAAKKALSGRGSEEGGEQRTQRRSSAGGGGGGDSTMSAMLTSGWDAAKDSLLPFAEDAAGAAGEWVAQNSPELVSETLVPRFIRGFEKARREADEKTKKNEE